MLFLLTSCDAGEKTVYLQSETAHQLKEGMSVYASGIEIGYLDKINLQPDLTVVSELKIIPDVNISRDAQMASQTISLLGETALELSNGNADDYLREGDTLLLVHPRRMFADSTIRNLFQYIREGLRPESPEPLLQKLDSVEQKLDSLLQRQ